MLKTKASTPQQPLPSSLASWRKRPRRQLQIVRSSGTDIFLKVIITSFLSAQKNIVIHMHSGFSNTHTTSYIYDIPFRTFFFLLTGHFTWPVNRPQAAAQGMSMEDGVLYAWRVGCVANLVSGFIATLSLGSDQAGLRGFFLDWTMQNIRL